LVVIFLVVGGVFTEFVKDFVSDDEVILAVQKVTELECELDVPKSSGG
jgi:hypothetical protein